jgi:hypothetical protein
MNGLDVKDLVLLVADADMEQAVRGLLARPADLGIRAGIAFDVFRHPRRDPGVFHEASDFLRPLQGQYRRALVLLDREGSGRETWSPRQIEEDIQRRLDSAGWKDRSAVVVLDPELEAWVFSGSPHVIRVIADGDETLYLRILRKYTLSDLGKPARPKEAMEEMLRQKRIPRSASLYGELARQVPVSVLSGCRDQAFRRFRRFLQDWFPPGE